MAPEQLISFILDFVLIIASLWMVYTIRGVGGVFGKTLNFIGIGTVILGIAHLQATLTLPLFGAWNAAIHRVVVLVGFLFLVYGFSQLRALK
ncbi:hypothetical protein MASR2M15_27960 [Anaerolineales bacterium]